MKPKFKVLSRWVVFSVAMVVVLSGVLPGAIAAEPEMFPCVADGQLEKEIAAGAELAELTCFFQRFEGKEALHVKVGVKNTGDQDQRFRVNLFFENGKAVGGLIPRKTGKGLVKAGATASFTYPVNGMTEKPGALMLKISTIAE